MLFAFEGARYCIVIPASVKITLQQERLSINNRPLNPWLNASSLNTGSRNTDCSVLHWWSTNAKTVPSEDQVFFKVQYWLIIKIFTYNHSTSMSWHFGAQSWRILDLDQPCPTRGPWAACRPVEGFVRPSLGFVYSKSILYTDDLSLFWQSWTWQFWCRWSSVPLYHCS